MPVGRTELKKNKNKNTLYDPPQAPDISKLILTTEWKMAESKPF